MSSFSKRDLDPSFSSYTGVQQDNMMSILAGGSIVSVCTILLFTALVFFVLMRKSQTKVDTIHSICSSPQNTTSDVVVLGSSCCKPSTHHDQPPGALSGRWTDLLFTN
jgi:hypothetical protein